MIKRCRGFLALALLVVLAQALGQERCPLPDVTTGAQAIEGFDALLNTDCLGGKRCDTETCQEVSNIVRLIEQNKAPVGAVSRLLEKLRDLALELSETQLGATQLHGMIDSWNLADLGDSTMVLRADVSEISIRSWRSSRFQLFVNTPYELNLETAFESCNTAAACKADFRSAVEVYSLGVLIYRVLEAPHKQAIDEFGMKLKTYDKQWTAFHNDSRAIFPWELIFNNWFYKPARQGFSGPPDYQWLLLHPSVGVVYDDSQEDKMDEVIVLDIFGRYQWKWGGKDNAEITWPFGIGVAASWSGEDPGYGISVHLPKNWSLAVTWDKNDNTLFIVSVDFGKAILDQRKRVDDIKERLENVRLKSLEQP